MSKSNFFGILFVVGFCAVILSQIETDTDTFKENKGLEVDSFNVDDFKGKWYVSKGEHKSNSTKDFLIVSDRVDEKIPGNYRRTDYAQQLLSNYDYVQFAKEKYKLNPDGKLTNNEYAKYKKDIYDRNKKNREEYLENSMNNSISIIGITVNGRQINAISLMHVDKKILPQINQFLHGKNVMSKDQIRLRVPFSEKNGFKYLDSTDLIFKGTEYGEWYAMDIVSNRRFILYKMGTGEATEYKKRIFQFDYRSFYKKNIKNIFNSDDSESGFFSDFYENYLKKFRKE